jgi:transposase
MIRIGMDPSKHIFQLHGVNAAEEPVLRKKLRRQDMVTFFTKLPPTVIGIEACGGSHHWARLLQSLGHQVKMLPPSSSRCHEEVSGGWLSARVRTPTLSSWRR